MYPWRYSDNFSDVIYPSIAPQYPVLLYVAGGIGLVVAIICNIVRPATPLSLLISPFYAALSFFLLYIRSSKIGGCRARKKQFCNRPDLVLFSYLIDRIFYPASRSFFTLVPLYKVALGIFIKAERI